MLVVGAGIHGAAVAWDAAQRGLATALVEREDFGSGTSWNSLKTIHGGMRHLQRLEIGSLRESARERSTLLRIAAPLMAPLPFFVPCYGYGARGRAALAIGLALSDALTRDRNRGLPPERSIPDGRTIGAAEALRLLPGLEPRGLTGGALWHDAQVRSSERLLLAFVHAAADSGAAVANHAEAVELLRAGGRVSGRRDPRRAHRPHARGPRADGGERGRSLGRRARRQGRRPRRAASAAAGAQPGAAPADGSPVRRGRAKRRPLPVPRALAGPGDRRHGVRAGGIGAERAAALPRGRGARLSVGRDRAARPRARARRPRAGGAGRVGPLHARPHRRPPGRRRRAGAADDPGREVHDRAGVRRARRRPGRRPARSPGGGLPNRGHAAREGLFPCPARSRSARDRRCGTRWPRRSPTPCCAGSTSAPRGRRRRTSSASPRASMAEELGWDAARERSERAALAAFFARRGGAGSLLE